MSHTSESNSDIKNDSERGSDSGSEPVFLEKNELVEYNLDQMVNIFSFLVGSFTNWGSLNIIGMFIGFNYKLLISKKFYLDIMSSLDGVVPSFVLGVFIVNIYIPYFFMSIVLGGCAQKYKIQLIDNYNDFHNNHLPNLVLVVKNNDFLQGLIRSIEPESKQE